MVENYDDMKGRVKEAAGDLTDDPELKQEGKIDQLKGKAKGLIDTVGDKLKG